MNKIVNRYLVFGFLKVIINVTLVFVCLGIILNLFEEIEFFKNLNTGIELPFILTMLFIPNLILKLLPFIIFISAMYFFISIKINKDLLSLKIFGYSNLRIVSILSITAFLFGIVTLFAINPVTSAMVKYYEQTKAKYSKDTDHLVSINKNGVWIKENIGNKFRIITAKNLDRNFLRDITIYSLNANYQITRRIESKSADISKNKWLLKNVTIFDLTKESDLVKKDDFYLDSVYDINKLNSLYRNLDTISFIELISEFRLLADKGYQKELLKEQLHTFLSLPVFLFLMVLLASIFTVNSINKAQNIYYIFISIIACAVIYYFKDLSIALAQTDRVPLIAGVWMPVIAIALFCSIGIIQINEK